MSSNVLTQSPVKLVTPEKMPSEALRGRDLVDHAMRNLFASSSPTSSPKKSETEGTSSAVPQAGLSLLPASLLLQKSFDLIASEVKICCLATLQFYPNFFD